MKRSDFENIILDILYYCDGAYTYEELTSKIVDEVENNLHLPSYSVDSNGPWKPEEDE